MDPVLMAAYAGYEAEKQKQTEQQRQSQPNLVDALGKLALGAGAVAAGAYGVRKMLGAGAVAPSKVPPSSADVRRAAGVVPADVARQQRGIELTRQARAERPQGVRQVDLSALQDQQVFENAIKSLTNFSNKVAADQFLARGKERAGVTGALTKVAPSPTEFLNQAVEEVAVKVLDQPGTQQLTGRTFQALPVGRATTEELAAGQRLLEDPELLSLVKQQTAEELSEARSYQAKAQAEYRNLLASRAEEARSAILKEANTTQAAAQEDFAGQYLRNQGYVAADTLVDQQQGRILGQVDHFANAVNSAEDQATGRTKVAIQRNEDANLAAVEMAEDAVDAQLARMAQQSPETAGAVEVDAAINQVASQLEDGLPVDQAEKLNIRTQGIDLRTGERFALTSKRPYTGGLQPGMEIELQEAAGPSKAQGFVGRALQAEREKIASELFSQEQVVIPSSVEKELAERFGRGSYEYGREYTKVKQAMEAGLEDPRYLEAQAASALPKTRMVGGQEFEVGVKNIMEDEPELAFRKPFISEETAISSEQQFIEKQNEIKDWLGGIRLEVAPQINKLQEQQKLLGEQQNMLLYSLNRQPNAELGDQLRLVSKQMQNNEMQLNRLNNRLSGATSAAQEQLSELEKWTPSTLIDWSGEGTVVRPKLTAPDTMSFESEGGELSNIERGSRMAQPGPEDLEIVPGGLLSGGRARVVSNIGQDIGFDPATGERVIVPLVDPDTGEETIQKLAGKRMGETIGVRGRGGSAGLGTRSSVGIYGTELSEYGTGAQTKSGQYTEAASQVPSLVNPEPVQRKTGGYFTYPQQRETAPQKFTQELTPERLASVRMSEAVLKANRLAAGRNPRGGVLPDETTLLRRKMAAMKNVPEATYGPRSTITPGSVPPQQLTLKGITGYKARQVKSPADQASEQLEAYMSKLQRGRAVPLTSEVRIQPRLF